MTAVSRHQANQPVESFVQQLRHGGTEFAFPVPSHGTGNYNLQPLRSHIATGFNPLLRLQYEPPSQDAAAPLGGLLDISVPAFLRGPLLRLQPLIRALAGLGFRLDGFPAVRPSGLMAPSAVAETFVGEPLA